MSQASASSASHCNRQHDTKAHKQRYLQGSAKNERKALLTIVKQLSRGHAAGDGAASQDFAHHRLLARRFHLQNARAAAHKVSM